MFGADLDTIRFAAGDVDNDGFADLVILRKAPDGMADLWSFGGIKYGDFWETPAKHFGERTEMAGAKLTVTDVNGDRRADIVLARTAAPNRTGFHVITGEADRTLASWSPARAVFGVDLATLEIG